MKAIGNSFGVLFYLKRAKKKHGECPIYVRITVNGQRVELSTKRTVEESSWNIERGMAKATKFDLKELNVYLEELRSRLVSIYQDARFQNKHITAEGIKNKFLGVDTQRHMISDMIEFHNQHELDALAPGSMKNYYTTQKYIMLFLKTRYKLKDMDVQDLSYKMIHDFERFLRNYKPIDHHNPLNNNGVMKHLERFRKMVNLIIRQDWIQKDPFAQVKLRYSRVERGYLTKEELQAVEIKDLKVPRLDYVRDLFVFACYTGLAYIDVVNLKPNNITAGVDGELWIQTSRQKTNTGVQVPLLSPALAIIKKYHNSPRALVKGTVFPHISNQKLNSYLKELADLCSIDKNFSFHLARHTFATSVTLSNGVPIESVSKMLGHTKITTTQIYAKVIERKVSDDMNALRKKLQRELEG